MNGKLGKPLLAGVGLAALVALAGCGRPAAPAANAAANAVAAPANAAIVPVAATSSDAADAKAFVEGLYAHYATNSTNSTFQPFDADAAKVLDPSTRALMKADEKALKGELGDIDGDWVCDCQDWESISATVTVDQATPTTAKATSVFHDKTDTGPPKRDTFDLVKTPDGWRIHDIGTGTDPSLRLVLTKEIARLKAGGHAVSGAD